MMKDEEYIEKGKGEMLRVMRSGMDRLLFFCSCLYSSLITPPSSFRIHHHCIGQNMQTFLLVPDLG